MIKILWYLSVKIGQLFFLFKRRKTYVSSQVKKIIINRSDRIGDAVITKPFLDILIEYLKGRWFTGTYTLLVSDINKHIFKDFVGEIEIVHKDLGQYDSNVFQLVWKNIVQWIACLRQKLKNKKHKYTTLMIDLVWDMWTIYAQLKKESIDVVSCNLRLWSIILDNWIVDSFVTLNHKNLLETYIDLIENTFVAKWTFRKFVYDHIAVFYSEYLQNKSTKKDWLLIFVGTKSFRNLSLQKREKIILHFSQYSNQKIVVIDDNTNEYYNYLIEKSFPDNVRILKNTFSLDEFKTFASKFQWILWVDGWGMNYIRNLTNNITIYTIGNYKIRHLFSGNKQYQETTLWNNWIMGKAVLDIGITNIYVAKNSFWLPSFDLELPKKMFDDLKISKLLLFRE